MNIEYIVYVLKKNLEKFNKESSIKKLVALLVPENKGLQRCLTILYNEGLLEHAKEYQEAIVAAKEEDNCNNSQDDKYLNDLIDHFFIMLTRDYAITETIAFNAIKIWLKVLGIYDERVFINLGIDIIPIIDEGYMQLYFINLEGEAKIVPVNVNKYYSLLYRAVNDPFFITYDFVASYFENHIETLVDNALSTLTEHEQAVLTMHFGLESGLMQSYEKISQDLNITSERILQIEKKARRKFWQPSRQVQMLKHTINGDKVDYSRLPIDYGRQFEQWLKEEIAYCKEGHDIDSMLFSKIIRKYFLKNEESLLIDSIHEFDISVRSFNILVRNNIKTIDDLMGISTEDLMGFRDMGRKALEEIEAIRNQIRLKRQFESTTLKVIEDLLINDNNSDSSLEDDLLITRVLINPKYMMSLLLKGFLSIDDFLTYYRDSKEQIFPCISEEIELFKELIPNYSPMLCVSVPYHVSEELDELEIKTLEDFEASRNTLSSDVKLVIDSIKLKYHYAKEWLNETQA